MKIDVTRNTRHRILLFLVVILGMTTNNIGVDCFQISNQHNSRAFQKKQQQQQQQNPLSSITTSSTALNAKNQNKKNVVNNKKSPPQEKEREENDAIGLLFLYMTPWKNPNAIFVYMLLIVYGLGKYSEAHSAASSTL